MSSAYSPWADLAARPDLTLVWQPMVGRVGEYVHALRLIRLDPRMPRRQARAVLAHELRHADAADTLTQCAHVNLRQEQRADRTAARLLIDVHQLADAMVLHDRRHSAVAVELHVSDRLLGVRLDHLHPSERAFLTRRLAD